VLWAGFLAGIAGYVDAICYLRLRHAFAANMTGNLVDIGLAAARGDWPRALWIVAIVCAFIAGIIPARLLLRAKVSVRAVLLLAALLMIPAATGHVAGAAIPLLAAVMAMQNETATHGIVSVNVAFVTGNMQRLGELIATGDKPVTRHFRRYELMIVAVLVFYACGAALGAMAAVWNARALLAAIAALTAAALCPERWIRSPSRQADRVP
jgi:uncharacterized membrane protein YoaK (UPF0700 family)